MIIQIRHTANTGNVPGPLANGELALNFQDQLLYYTHANGNVILLANGATLGVDSYARTRANGAFDKANGAAQNAFVTINVAGQNNVVADSNSDTLILASGPGIIITTDAANDIVTLSSTISTSGFAFIYANTPAPSGMYDSWANLHAAYVAAGSPITKIGFYQQVADPVYALQIPSGTWDFQKGTQWVGLNRNVGRWHQTTYVDTDLNNNTRLNFQSGARISGVEQFHHLRLEEDAPTDSIMDLDDTVNANSDPLAVSTVLLYHTKVTGTHANGFFKALTSGCGIILDGISQTLSNAFSEFSPDAFPSQFLTIRDRFSIVSANSTITNNPASGLYVRRDGVQSTQVYNQVLWHGSVSTVRVEGGIDSDKPTELIAPGTMFYQRDLGYPEWFNMGAWNRLWTANIAESTSNLFFTSARVRANVSNVSPINYDPTTGVFSLAAGVISNSFVTINVAGQNNVVADSNTDTLTLVAGSGISITTDATNDTITFAATGGSSFDQYARNASNNEVGFIFSDVAANGVYTNWATLYAAYVAANSPATLIGFQGTSLSIPAGTYNFRYPTRWAGLIDGSGQGTGSSVQLVFDDTATISGVTGFESLTMQSQSDSIIEDASGYNVTLKNSFMDSTSAAEFLHFETYGAMILSDGSILSTNAINIGTQNQFDMYINGPLCRIENSSILGPNANIPFIIHKDMTTTLNMGVQPYLVGAILVQDTTGAQGTTGQRPTVFSNGQYFYDYTLDTPVFANNGVWRSVSDFITSSFDQFARNIANNQTAFVYSDTAANGAYTDWQEMYTAYVIAGSPIATIQIQNTPASVPAGFYSFTPPTKFTSYLEGNDGSRPTLDFDDNARIGGVKTFEGLDLTTTSTIPVLQTSDYVIVLINSSVLGGSNTFFHINAGGVELSRQSYLGANSVNTGTTFDFSVQLEGFSSQVGANAIWGGSGTSKVAIYSDNFTHSFDPSQPFYSGSFYRPDQPGTIQGTTAQRPAFPANGQMYFDFTVDAPVFANNDVWHPVKDYVPYFGVIYVPNGSTLLEVSVPDNGEGVGEALRAVSPYNTGSANGEMLATRWQVGNTGPLSYVKLDLSSKANGSLTGYTYWVTLEADAAGDPSGTPLATSTSYDASLVPDAADSDAGGTATPQFLKQMDFPTPFTIVNGTDYWVVLHGDYPKSDAAHLFWNLQNGSPPTGGLSKTLGTDLTTWVTVSGGNYIFEAWEVSPSQANVISDTSNDVLTLISGNGVSIITDAPNDTITIQTTGGDYQFVNSPTGGTGTPGSSDAYVNVASMVLTPGDWDVQGTIEYVAGGTSAVTRITGAISLSSNALDFSSNGGVISITSSGFVISQAQLLPTGARRVSIVANTTVNLVGLLTYTVLGGATWGTNSFLSARRAR